MTIVAALSDFAEAAVPTPPPKLPAGNRHANHDIVRIDLFGIVILRHPSSVLLARAPQT